MKLWFLFFFSEKSKPNFLGFLLLSSRLLRVLASAQQRFPSQKRTSSWREPLLLIPTSPRQSVPGHFLLVPHWERVRTGMFPQH